jgi:calcineurin-like phosphoesterase family protein
VLEGEFLDMIYFTADTHFGHAAIIEHSQRPFASVTEMDTTLVAQWNGVVQPRDTVYHLGDFCYKSVTKPEAYLKKLNGTIHLIRGNHDNETIRLCGEQFASVSDLLEVVIEGQRIVLCHYAMRVWPKSHNGSWHLYGHSHGTLTPELGSKSLDVGVDCHGYYPLAFSKLQTLIP